MDFDLDFGRETFDTLYHNDVKNVNSILRKYAEGILESEKEFLTKEEYEKAIIDEIEGLTFEEIQKIFLNYNKENVFVIPLEKVKTNTCINLFDF